MSAEFAIPPIVLASTSPRRAMLLRQVGIEFEMIPPDAEEHFPRNGDWAEIMIGNAARKAASVIPHAEGRAVLGADTLVDLDGIALGKPQDSFEAASMLQRLSGRSHRVHTAIVLIDSARGLRYDDCVTTTVTFRTLSSTEIDRYIASGEPFDKAGAYGIQERGALFIAGVEGCFFNVMGLPLARLWEMLQEWAGGRGP